MGAQIAGAAERAAFETFCAARAAGAGAEALAQCREVTDSIYNGLDLEREILAVEDQGLGETVLLRDGGRLRGFAVCHLGAGSEAGSEVSSTSSSRRSRRHAGAAERFERLVAACESLAADRGADRLDRGGERRPAGAYRALLARGYRAIYQRAHDAPPRRSRLQPSGDAYVIDDLRSSRRYTNACQQASI